MTCCCYFKLIQLNFDMNYKLIFLILTIFNVITVIKADTIEENNETFVPTSQWKEIREGQSIPAGLHVRINLQTGKKEAKLLEDEEAKEETTKDSALVLTDNPSSDDTVVDQGDENFPEAEIKKLSKSFKSHDTINKKGKEDLNVAIPADISEIFKKYDEITKGKEESKDDVKQLFEMLQDLVHHIDKANEFINFGGLDKIIIPNIRNQSDTDLKISAIRLLGTIVQNNPKGQIAAFEKNIGQCLLKMVVEKSSEKELPAILFGLGGILRKFPIAQKEILNKPGLKLFVELLNRHIEFKTKLKCLQLITDLIRDYNEVTNVPYNGDLHKIKQYNAADIKGRLSETDYCKTMDELFSVHRREFLDNLYVAEEILETLMLSKDICQPVWAESPIFRHTLLVIKNNYDRIREKPQLDLDKSDLENLTSTLGELNEFLFSHITIKDEL
uniref:Nucleotide exchange factor SIL1 n=1 Tax=Culicoides sonorensis TaxID=179676 RepID=A0A336LID7_CULSO